MQALLENKLPCGMTHVPLHYTQHSPERESMKVDLMCKRLVEKGFSQREIASMVEARGATCPPSQLSRVLRGRIPNYTLGDAIRRVYMEKCEAPAE